jgi:ornithine cyclodeaminase/alanine dehydrogenase-like protein (mu-crystallin family)
MSQPPYLDGAALRAALPVPAAVDALERAFAAGELTAPPRGHHAVAGGDLLVMPATGPVGTGVKLVTVVPGNPGRGLPLIAGLYVLFDAETLRPAALVEAAALTALRTSAVSALAARHLARPDAEHLVVIGAGTQARAHIEALAAVLPVRRVTLVSRTPEGAARLVEEARAAGFEAVVGTAAAVAEADLVACCTTSREPVLAGADLPPGVHVTAVGAYRPDARELDTEVVRRGRVVVEDRAAALAEAGDLAIPIAEGAVTPDVVVADLGEVVRGASVRRGPDDITVFKSVGLASEDLAVVAAALARRGGAVQ